MTVICGCGHEMREICSYAGAREFVCDRCLTRVELRAIAETIPWAKPSEPLELRVRTSPGREFYLPAVPTDVTPAEIVEQLIQQGVVDPPHGQQAYEFALRESDCFRQLDATQTLEAAGVPSGATLLLASPAIPKEEAMIAAL